MKKNKRKIHVIGINSFKFEELSNSLQKLINSTQNIAAPAIFIDQIKKWDENFSNKAKKFFVSKSDNKLIKWLKEIDNDVILLSRGDPLWFGIGRILLDNFSKEELTFYPSNTCLQLAFSKLKKPWQEINYISIHGRDSAKLIKALKSRSSEIAIINDSKNKGLELIKKNLLELNLENSYEFWLCEELGFNKERIRQLDIKENLPKDILDLNIIILINKEINHSELNLPLFGINDNFFRTFKDRPNLITKREIRIQILADLELPETGIIWDIGAGSGTIGLEALKLRPNLKLFLIDKRFGTKKLISENAKRLKVFPKKIFEEDIRYLIESKFKELQKIPDRIIIGGCDEETKIYIIKKLSVFMNKGNIIVIPIITFEVLQNIMATLEELKFETNFNLIQTFKGLSISEGTRLEPNNPVFIIKGKKL